MRVVLANAVGETVDQKKSMTSFSSNDSALLQLARDLQNLGYRFTTVTPKTHERVNARDENKTARNLRDVFGWSRTFQAEVLPPPSWELMQKANVVEKYENGWKSSVRFSSLQNQLFVHSAFPTTQSDAVFFGPDTYRYANALQNFFATNSQTVKRAVDIGCGSGVGAILTALRFPEAEVFAVDINERALRYTRVNAALSSTRNVRAQHSDLLKNVDGDFDLIIANPPYLVDESERAYRHGGGPLGAGLSLQIVQSALERLARGGTLLLYTGVAMLDGKDPFRTAVEELVSDADVSCDYRETDPDVFGEELESGVYARTERIAAVVLTMTRR